MQLMGEPSQPIPGWSSARALCAAIAAAAMVLAGCGGEPAPRTVTVTESAPPIAAPPVTTTAEPATMSEWMKTAATPVGDVGDALIAVGQAMQDVDYGAIRATCPDLRAASDALDRALPSPDPEVTSALQDAVDNWRSLSQMCSNIAPPVSDAEMQQMNEYLDTGGTRMCDAYELMGLDTGCRG